MNALKVGQRVLIITDGDEAFFDSGRVTTVQHEGFEPDVLDQIKIKSDFLDEEEVVFRFSQETDRWVRFFQDPLGDPGFLVFDQHEPPYSIIGMES